MKFTWCLFMGLLGQLSQLSVAKKFFNKTHPLIMVTWNYLEAAETGWNTLFNEKRSAIDTVEAACKYCEVTQCRGTVGYGGITDEDGEPTLDAMIMDGVTMDVGGVGGMRRIKHAVSVARKILETTEHTLLVGDSATKFAVEMGFPEESLSTNNSDTKWKAWRDNSCQPNFRKNVSPDPEKYCGPYKPIKLTGDEDRNYERIATIGTENHDTIGVIAIDWKGRIAAATSTNGVRFKIPGRVGDSPLPGAGAYADAEVGAAASTGIGDIMMRFAPSFLAVDEMRRGASPAQAAKTAINRITRHYPAFGGAVLAIHKDGRYGVACNNIDNFPYIVGNPLLGGATQHYVNCSEPESIVPAAEQDKRNYV